MKNPKILQMATTLCGLFALAMTLSCSSVDPVASGKRPNIILFFVDDLGWQDTSVPFWKEKTSFNRTYRTPNMEQLAASGMKFTQAYATPVCSPTRVSLMTGMNAARHRVTNWTLHPDKIQPMEANHQALTFPRWNVNGLTPDSTIKLAVYATTFPSILQQHGYRTIHAGKAHFGAIGTPGEDPTNLGFDVNIAGHAAGAPASYLGTENFGNTPENEGSPWPVPGLEKYHGQDIFLTEALTREVLAELEQVATSQPFYLYMSLYGVHTPIKPDRRFVQRYYDLGMDSTEAQYASMIEAMDKSLGDLMNYLDQHQLTQETIILFMSDNGGLSAVARGGEAHTHNKPLSSGKGSIHEGGIREPMLLRWPGVVPENTVNDQYLIIEDFFPSILEMARINEFQTVQSLDGQSFVPLLSSTAKAQDRSLYWHYPNEWGPSGPGIGAYSAVRRGDLKLIYYHQSESFELFDLADDLKEQHNLADEHPVSLRALAQDLTHYLQAVDAQMPAHKSSGQPVAWPAERTP